MMLWDVHRTSSHRSMFYYVYVYRYCLFIQQTHNTEKEENSASGKNEPEQSIIFISLASSNIKTKIEMRCSYKRRQIGKYKCA